LKTRPENLGAQLARGLPRVCLVSGDEPLLVAEACDLIRGRARELGCTEREIHFVERGFDWASLRASSRSLSLFAERRLVEIRMPTGAPGEAGGAVLTEFAQESQDDIVVLIVTGRLDARALGARWVSAIDQHGLVVQIWPMELARLPAWVSERLRRHGLEAEPAAAAMIAERVEGNLLAAHQEIEKLALLLPAGRVTAAAVVEAVADSARFDVLQLGEAAMRGQAGRATRILHGLREEGVDATLVLWAINKDLQWIVRCLERVHSGQPVDAALAAERVWRPRQAAMKLALARLPRASARDLIVDAARTDRAIKGALRSDPWLELEALVARFAGVELARVA